MTTQRYQILLMLLSGNIRFINRLSRLSSSAPVGIPGVGTNGNFMNSPTFTEDEKLSIIKYIDELKYADKRDNALIELSR